MKETVRQTLATILATWNSSILPVSFENQDKPKTAGQAWGRVSITFGDSTAAAIGITFERQVGLVTMQVFVPDGGGVSVSTKAGDELARLLKFQAVAFNHDGKPGVIQCEAVSGPMPAGAREGYQQFMLSLVFRADLAR